MKWVTREFVHVDRTACPWLIKKFIDPQAEFIFVSTEKIAEIAKNQGATPFDAPGVKLGHRNGKCGFETIIEEYKLKDQYSMNSPKSFTPQTQVTLNWRLKE